MKNVFNSSVIFFLSLVYSSVSIAQYQNPSPCSQLIWEDNFDGTTLDASKWSAQLGDGCDIGNCGWGNNEEQYYTDRSANIVVENGVLKIIALKEDYSGKAYTSARVRSFNKGDFTFGRIEASIKLPKGAGSWPAFWMLPTDEVYGSWPQSGELDIMEFQGKTPTFVSGTAHYGGPLPDHKFRGLIQTLPSGQFYYDNFHTFAIEWDSTSIRWYMDDINYHTLTNASILPNAFPFDQRFHVILNNAIGGYLGGIVDNTTFPQVMEVDYVRVYSIPFNRTMRGKGRVYENTPNVLYTLPGDLQNENSYVWTVPSGASIVNGQGTKQISVNWGPYVSSTPVNVSLNVTTACDVFTLNYPVTLYQDACNMVIEDAENIHNAHYKFSTNTYSSAYINNNPNAVNASSVVLRYIGNSQEVNNRVVYNDILLSDITAYESGSKVLFLDVMSSAPIGTEINLRFQSSLFATTTNYPAGIRSTCSAHTAKQGEWERLKFTFSNIDNVAINANEVDELAIVFNPGSSTDVIYFFDNLKQGKVQQGCILDDVQSATQGASLFTYPNPVRDNLTIQWREEAQTVDLFILDVMGNVVLSRTNVPVTKDSGYPMDLSALSTGTYYVRVISDHKTLVSQLIKM